MRVLAQEQVAEQGAELLAASIGGGLLLALAVGIAALLCTRSTRGTNMFTFSSSFGVVASVTVLAVVMMRARSGDAGLAEAAWGLAATATCVVLARWTWKAEERTRRVRS